MLSFSLTRCAAAAALCFAAVTDALAAPDAAFGGLGNKAGVVERFGLQGFGAHSGDAEYVLVDSIEPSLYLMTRMVMDIARGRVGAH